MPAPKECPFCEVEHTVQMPVIHNNGTSPGELRDQIVDLLDSIIQIRRRMAVAWPNGRDYYVVPGAYERASREWEERSKALREMGSAFEEIRDHVQSVIDFKERNRR